MRIAPLTASLSTKGSLRASALLEAFDEIDRVFNPLPQFFSLVQEFSTTMKQFSKD
jgi:hypothetical protein